METLGREELVIELQPTNAESSRGEVVCAQGCPHCTVSKKGSIKTAGYPLAALEALEKIEKYLTQKGSDLFALYIGALSEEDTFEEGLPIWHVPDYAVYELGEIKPKSDVETFIRRYHRGATQLFQNLPNHSTLIIPSVVPTLDENGEIEALEEIALLNAFLAKRTKNESFKKARPNGFCFHIDNNAVDPILFDTLSRPWGSIQAEILAVLLERIASKEATLRHEKNTSERYSFRGSIRNYLVSATRDYTDFRHTIKRRLVRGGKPDTERLPLNLMDPRLGFQLMDDHVWVEHSTKHTTDDTCRISYPDFYGFLKEASEGDDFLRDLLKREIMKRRGQSTE